MNIHLCIPAFVQTTALARCLEAVYQSTLLPSAIHIIDNDQATPKTYPRDSRVPLDLYIAECNLGVARTWNRFLYRYDDFIIILNDDFLVSKNTIQLLVQTAVENPQTLLFVIDGWCCFLQRKRSLDLIGGYDENFSPAYYEDSDYSRRMWLAGYEAMALTSRDPEARHIGSAPLDQVRKEKDVTRLLHMDFSRSVKYYQHKWGGWPGHETYLRPFNIV